VARLAGFRYREIVKRLKELDSSLTGRRAGRTRSGSTPPAGDTQPSPTILATCLREPCAQS